MDDNDLLLLKRIAFAVAGNLALFLAIFLIFVWRLGWRQTLRRIGEWTLVISVYFDVAIIGMAVLMPPCYRWVTLHTHYSFRQIADEGISIERYIGKHTAVFSNGESRPIGIWPRVVATVLAFSWWGFDVWLTLRLARRFAPSVWAEFQYNRPARPIPDDSPPRVV